MSGVQDFGTGVCPKAAWDFARMEEFWQRFQPLSPYGRDTKEERLVLADKNEIEKLHDETETMLAFEASLDESSRDRVAWHLRRLGRLPFTRGDTSFALGLMELFQVKKFIANYRAIVGLADEKRIGEFGLRFESERLASMLDEGGSDPETFFIADASDERLPPLRAAIAEQDRRLAAARAADKAKAKLARGLDFSVRDFLVIDHGRAQALLSPIGEEPRFLVESYDSSSCVVRIQDGPAALALEEERSALLAREREVEAEVLARLSQAVAAEAQRLLSYAEAIRRFDLARARAVLAREHGLIRPALDLEGIALRKGRFLPCLWECEGLGLEYQSLDIELRERGAFLFGSNMGGKTVALRSLLFFQIAAQAGLFVPASSFASRVYQRIDYVGELRERIGAGEKTGGGLSGFGFEIRAFSEVWEKARRGGAFVVFDEFARTTSSAEAEAILGAAAEALAALPETRAVFATHFRGVPSGANLRRLRMRGLDRNAARAVMESAEAQGRGIKKINQMMRYDIVEADEDETGSDAVAIARLLGLDESIAARAEALYEKRGQ